MTAPMRPAPVLRTYGRCRRATRTETVLTALAVVGVLVAVSWTPAVVAWVCADGVRWAAAVALLAMWCAFWALPVLRREGER